jgi:hypothetical protein
VEEIESNKKKFDSDNYNLCLMNGFGNISHASKPPLRPGSSEKNENTKKVWAY